MKEFFIALGSTVVLIILSSVLVAVGKFAHVQFERLKQATDNETLKNLISKLDYIVQLCVEATNQKFVNDKKKTGEFTKEDMEEAFTQTLNNITNMLTDEDKEMIISNFGDVSTLICNSIESYIKQSKDI
jgi:hypothetical protein